MSELARVSIKIKGIQPLLWDKEVDGLLSSLINELDSKAKRIDKIGNPLEVEISSKNDKPKPEIEKISNEPEKIVEDIVIEDITPEPEKKKVGRPPVKVGGAKNN